MKSTTQLPVAAVLVLGGLLTTARASFTTAVRGGPKAVHQTNVSDENAVVDDRRGELASVPVVGMGQRVRSEAIAGGNYEVPATYRTGCVKNDGLTDCDGTEGPGESGRIYTSPETYQIIGDGTARAIAGITVDRGVVRADAISLTGGPVSLSTPVPRPNADQLYPRHVHNKEAFVQLGADVFTRTVVRGPAGGAVGRVTLNGVVEGSISGNGDRHLEAYDPDPTNFQRDGVAGARFIISATSWVNGYTCFNFPNGCPGKSVTLNFGAETSPTENGSFVRPFSIEVDVIDGFVLQTAMMVDAYARGDSAARFGNTARIDTIAVSEGFELDVADGDLARAGNMYTFVATLPEESTTTTTTLSGATTTTTLPDCGAAAGLAAARCRLDAALARPLCAELIPKAVDRRLRVPLQKAAAALQRALAVSGAKQARLVRRALALLNRANGIVGKAAAARRPQRALPAACADAVRGLTGAISAAIAPPS